MTQNPKPIGKKKKKNMDYIRYCEWQQDVLKLEGLKGWHIKNTNSGGGLTIFKGKTIYAKTMCSALFLHEVAHALLPIPWENGKKNTGHDAIWGDQYTDLVNRYLKIL